jgi:predicted  nucleic acid-binding Zn-ribbon protein
MDLSETLLLLVGAVAPDGGRGVGQALRAILEEAVPFDAAEAVLHRPGGWVHSRLDDGDGVFAGDDLLSRLAILRAPLRIDDLPEAASLPDTERRMGALGLRSLLAIPFAAGAPSGGAAFSGPEGAIVLARRFGWAFAGASLHLLWPVAGLAGRAFELAIALTALTERTERLEGEVARLAATPEALEAEREGLRQELEDARREAREAQAAADDLRVARAEASSRALDLERALGETASERDVIREELASATLALEAERRDGREARSRVEEALGRIGEREAALGEAQARSESLRAELEAARAELETARGELAVARAERDTARAERDHAWTERDAARAGESAAAERADQRSVDLEVHLREAQAARQEMSDGVDRLREETSELRRAKEAAEKEHEAHVRSLREELQAAHAAASDKGAALVQAEERCRQLEALATHPSESVPRRGPAGSPRRRL